MLEDIKAELERVVSEIQKRPHDKHELYLDLHQKLNVMRAIGMPVAGDLVLLEQELEHEFARENRLREQPSCPQGPSRSQSKR